jgi:tetratricopeptide (TPR) repeat protein
LVDVALIDNGEENLSIHRLVQTTFLHYLDESALKKAFETAVYLLNEAFPKQLFGRPLVNQWPQCERYILHAQNVARIYDQFQVLHPADDFCEPGIDLFLELLSNCAWYLLEIGDWNDSGDIIRIAKSACTDKNSLIYSHLENTLGCSAFELNDLTISRQSYEAALNIRRKLLKEGDEDLLCTINNYANLLNGEGRAEEALKLYAEVQQVREKMGEETQVPLSLTYLGSGQALDQLGRYDAAKEFFDKAYSIITQHQGPEGHYVKQ